MINFKKLITSFIILFVASFFIFPQTALSAEYDQGCTPDNVANITVYNHYNIYQTFAPVHNRLTRVGLWMEGDGNGDVILKVQHNADILGSDSRSEPNGYALIYFDFDNIELTPGDSNYRLKPTTSKTNADLNWHRSTSPDCNVGGYAYFGTGPKDYDMGFATFGSLVEQDDPGGDDSDNPADDSNEQPGIDTETNLGTAPSENISDDLLPPTNVSAKNTTKNDKIAVKISWTKSETEDIDGYKIFRKIDVDSEYGQIAQTQKSIIEFSDADIVENTDYTYMLRSYKNELESENSQEAFITAKKPSKKVTNSVYSGTEYSVNWTDPWFLAFIIVAILEVGFVILWYLRHRRKRIEEQQQ